MRAMISNPVDICGSMPNEERAGYPIDTDSSTADV
jgi:hypothetical protein